jgi:hypothetical protein
MILPAWVVHGESGDGGMTDEERRTLQTYAWIRSSPSPAPASSAPTRNRPWWPVWSSRRCAPPRRSAPEPHRARPQRHPTRHSRPERSKPCPRSPRRAPNIQEYGPALDVSGQLDDYTVNFVTIRQTHSLADCSRGLPRDSCPCPHWGYLFTGKITVTYADREETYHTRDTFYMAPGHVPTADTGSEFVPFSPSEALAQVRAVTTRNAPSTPTGGRKTTESPEGFRYGPR